MGFNLKEAGNSVSNFIGMTHLKLKAVSPEICLGAGLICMTGAVVAGIFAAKKHDAIMTDHEDRLEEAKAEFIISEDPESGEETEVKRDLKDINRSVRKVYVETGFKMVKNYALTGALMAVSAGFFCEMHNIMGGRIAGLTGAYTGLQEYIRRYEDNNIKLNGEESHRMCKYGFKEVEIEEEDPDTGEMVKEKKLVPNEAADVCDDEFYLKGEANKHFAVFSKQTSPSYTGRADFDLMLLENAHNTILSIVDSRGWAVENELYSLTGLQETVQGATAGWYKGGPKVDLGIYQPVNNKFLAKYNDQPVLLELNVCEDVISIVKKREAKDLQEKRVIQQNGVLTYAETGAPTKKMMTEFLAEG